MATTSYAKIFKSLSKAKIKYLVAGGIAVNLHGVERATADLDLIVHLETLNLTRFIQLMTSLGYVPKVPVKPLDFADAEKRRSWIEDKNMMVFSFIKPDNPMEMIDVFVKEPIPFAAAYKKRTLRKAFDVMISVLDINDLIRIKKDAGRPKDLYDVSMLELVRKNKSK